jgi:hypothetical protein
MGINGNEIADELARQGSLHPLIGPEHALGIFAKVVRAVIKDWTSRKYEEHCSPYVGKGKLRAFLRNPLQKDMGNCST